MTRSIAKVNDVSGVLPSAFVREEEEEALVQGGTIKESSLKALRDMEQGGTGSLGGGSKGRCFDWAHLSTHLCTSKHKSC